MSDANWVGCDMVLQTIEDAMRECPSYHQRCRIYDKTVNVHRPWYWTDDNDEFIEIEHAASAVWCQCASLGWDSYVRVDPETRIEKQKLLDAEKRFVQALHFNEHVRRNHDCKLSYRDACYFGVDAVWCACNGVESEEVDGSSVLPYLRILFQDTEK